MYDGNDFVKIYNAGIYLRLSREDEREGQSESIENQKDFLTRYAAGNRFAVIEFYIDDGYSGTNFNRPAFKQMIGDIEKGKINTVITKDLSRLGRDYIDTGYYLEKYFPSKKIRYIAVNDGIDTFNESDGDMTPFKAVINDMYAKDVSKKVRTAITTKKLKGEFIGSVAPYGYVKDENNKNRLIIDAETAPVVKKIFNMFIDKPSVIGIAKRLTSEKIPTPSELKKLAATQKQFKGVWNDAIIKRILTNPTYIGNLTQNRSKKINYKISKQRSIPKEEWITVENTHEPIIKRDDFEAVQNLLAKRTYINRCSIGSKHILSGLLICADCKKNMTFSKSGNVTYIVCSSRKKFGSLNLCPPKSIREDYVEAQVMKKLKELAVNFLDNEMLLNGIDSGKYNNPTTDAENELKNIGNKLEEINQVITSLYKDKVKNIISEEEFLNLLKEFRTQKEKFLSKINSLEIELEQLGESDVNNEKNEELFRKFLSFDQPERSALASLISEIEIHCDKTIVITFDFSEPTTKNG